MDNNTVCDKVSDSIKILEKCLATNELDLPKLMANLHGIRKDAQKMENALKSRKKLMTKAGIEDEYQSQKVDDSKPTRGINKIYRVDEKTKEDLEFETIIKKNGEVVYQNTASSGVLCFVESLDDIDDNGYITGQTQNFMFGKDLAIFFALDQLRQAIEQKSMNILLTLKTLVESGQLRDPKVKAKLLKAQGGKL